MGNVVDLGVDLGTASVVIYGRGKGMLLNEAACIAYDRDTRNVLAVGDDAYKMVGRAPGNIVVVRPLGEGIVKDFELVSAMLRYLISSINRKRLFSSFRVLISMPDGVNEMEQRGITTSLFETGARRVQMMERPIAAAIGSGMPLGDPYGRMICEIGGGTTEIAVIALGRIVVRESVKIAGDAFDDAIIKYLRRKHNLLVGPLTAEELKKNIGFAMPQNEQYYMEVPGRDLLSGLPVIMRINSDEITEALDEPVHQLLEAIHSVLEHTPAELVADIFETGIVFSGGGAQLGKLCEAAASALKVECFLAENPQECVARGCGATLENMSEYGQFLGNKRGR